MLLEIIIPTSLWYIDVVITFILYALVIWGFNKLIHRKILIPFFAILFVCKTLTSLLGLELTANLFDLAAIGTVVGYTSLYSQEIRRKLLSRKRRTNQNNQFSEVLQQQINDAVMYLSANRIGAIITFEMHDNLDHYIQGGDIINAPVNSALIKTIFYEGTALHDGAIIIRDNTICAASVYFTPSVKPLVGKYGSRHRAALGISEVTDAVTVVVSEETGRITFTRRGEMIPTARDNFLKQLQEFLGE